MFSIVNGTLMKLEMPSLIQILGSIKLQLGEWINMLIDFLGCFLSTHKYEMVHEECQHCVTIDDMFDELDGQTLRNCRTDSHHEKRIECNVVFCSYCCTF